MSDREKEELRSTLRTVIKNSDMYTPGIDKHHVEELVENIMFALPTPPQSGRETEPHCGASIPYTVVNDKDCKVVIGTQPKTELVPLDQDFLENIEVKIEYGENGKQTFLTKESAKLICSTFGQVKTLSVEEIEAIVILSYSHWESKREGTIGKSAGEVIAKAIRAALERTPNAK